MADEAVDTDDAAFSEPVGAIVVKESNSQRNFLYGFLTVVFAVAAVRGILSHPSGLTLIVVVVMLVVMAIVGTAWWATWRDPYRIEISVERLRYLGRKAHLYNDFVRDHGTDLWLYTRPVGRSEVMVLEQVASGQQWVLRFFKRQPIIDACHARGWQIVSTPHRPS